MNLVVLALVINGALAGTIVEEFEKEPELSYFLDMVEMAGFMDVLQADGPFTVIAPMNSGFRKLHPGVIASLAADATLYRTVTTPFFSSSYFPNNPNIIRFSWATSFQR